MSRLPKRWACWATQQCTMNTQNIVHKGLPSKLFSESKFKQQGQFLSWYSRRWYTIWWGHSLICIHREYGFGQWYSLNNSLPWIAVLVLNILAGNRIPALCGMNFKRLHTLYFHLQCYLHSRRILNGQSSEGRLIGVIKQMCAFNCLEFHLWQSQSKRTLYLFLQLFNQFTGVSTLRQDLTCPWLIWCSLCS